MNEAIKKEITELMEGAKVIIMGFVTLPSR